MDIKGHLNIKKLNNHFKKNKMTAEKDFQKFALSKGISSMNMHYYKQRFEEEGTVTGLTPNVVDDRNSMQNSVVLDVFSRLVRDRLIFLGTGIDSQVANIICAQLLYLEMVDANKDINLYVSSPGGSVTSGLAIIRTMDYIAPKVATTALDMAASMGFMILCCGFPQKRSALLSTRIMAHQISGGATGTHSDVRIRVKEMEILEKELYTLISERCGLDYEEVVKRCERDFWMSPVEAKGWGKHGVIDHIIGRNENKFKGTHLE